MRYCSLLCGLLLLPAARALAAADDPPAMQQVQINGAGADQRRLDTTATIIVGRDDILRYGDRTLADVLKRLPGISIATAQGQAGEIRMRGLGSGYTLIMLNGVPAPAGFTLDSLAPELIERIEILRAPTAESSNQAIAGSINIVLRKSVAHDERSITTTMARQAGRNSPGLAAQLARRADDFSYTVGATLTRNSSIKSTLAWEERRDSDGQLQLLRRTPQSEIGRDDTLTIAPRLNWTLANGDTLASQNFVELRRIDRQHHSNETALAGDDSEFPNSAESYIARNTELRSDLSWSHALADDGGKFDAKVSAGSNRRSADFHFYGADLNRQPAGQHYVASGPAETKYVLTGSWHLPLGEHHALAMGWDGGYAIRREYRRENQYAADATLLEASDQSYQATVRRLALFAQDEWDISPRWSLYAGLRRESLASASTARDLPPVDTRSSVWSPSLQTLYKLDARNQLRLALSRSYKAPAMAELVPRRYTTDNDNSPANPDTQGNPNLRPELAWGLDAACEHYLSDGALLSASVFLRRIRDVTQQQLFQSGGAWITTPINDGNASVHGIELEAKLPLPALIAQAPAIELHANLARNWSTVEQVPGPDNRLERQLPFSANLGLDYRLRGMPLTVGGSFNFQGGGPVRQSIYLSSDSGPQRQLDLYALYTIDGRTRLRLSGANLLRQDYAEQASYADDSGTLYRTWLTGTSATLRLALEHQF